MRPSWVTTVGVLGIILSCLGILGAANTLVTPTIMEMQKEMFTRIQKEYPHTSDSAQESAAGRQSSLRGTLPPKEFMQMFEKMWNMPQWFKQWSLFSGFIAMCIWGFFLFASIWLLQLKKNAPRLFLGVLTVNLIFLACDSIASGFAGSFMGISKIAGNSFWFVVSVVLLIVVSLADKKVFSDPLHAQSKT
jgi:hypothetical protein